MMFTIVYIFLPYNVDLKQSQSIYIYIYLNEVGVQDIFPGHNSYKTTIRSGEFR